MYNIYKLINTKDFPTLCWSSLYFNYLGNEIKHISHSVFNSNSLYTITFVYSKKKLSMPEINIIELDIRKLEEYPEYLGLLLIHKNKLTKLKEVLTPLQWKALLRNLHA